MDSIHRTVAPQLRSRLSRLLPLLLAALILTHPAAAAVFTVTHAGDTGAGSLRQAILDAENTPGPDSIRFQIPGTGPFTIALQSPLPAIREPIILDGASQPGYTGRPLIELNGAAAGPNAHGIYLLTSNSVIRALCINRFSGDGIRIEFGASNVVEGCYVGLRPDGRTAAPNQQGGITIRSPGNRIGGNDPTQRNVIAGGNQGGIFLLDPPATGNTIQGNYIGTDATGTNALGNLQNGILISSAPGNLIGGTNLHAGNLLSGNGQAGVYLMYPGAAFNRILGNRIGTDASGLRSLGNLYGVVLFGATSNWIGGLEPGAGNLISGNRSNGVHVTLGPGGGGSFNQIAGNWIGPDLSGTNALANAGRGIELFRAAANRIGPSNVISGNQLSGITLSGPGTTNNVLVGNRIGTDPAGLRALSNRFDGLLLLNVSNNIVGGTNPGDGNLISGNGANGIYLAGTNSRANHVLGNFIGTDAEGRQPLPNALSGVRIEGPDNRIGDTLPGAGNLISGNLENGVFLVERSASHNVLAGNIIGLDSRGQTLLGNQVAGIGITNAPANLIGGPEPGAGNLISGNADSGIYLIGPLATGNRIQGNRIGTDLYGLLARGNGRDGISGYNAPTNFIGGDLPGAGNLISGNLWNGLYLTGPGTRGWILQGNWIGVQADGWSPLGNLYHNIEFLTNSSQHLVGGISPFAANRIAWARSSGWDGIRIRPGSTNITIAGNAIFSNGGPVPNGLGIDLGNDGVTPNDACDSDTGANFQQNFPVLTQAVASASALAVRGWLESASNRSYLLWFYLHPTNEPSGHGEGMWPLGQATVVTDSSCRTNFSITLPVSVPPGMRITATATDPNGNTSEFGPGIPAEAPPQLQAHFSSNPTRLTLRWPASPAGFILQQTTNLAPPVLWQPVPENFSLLNGWYQLTLTNPPGPRFYRLALP